MDDDGWFELSKLKRDNVFTEMVVSAQEDCKCRIVQASQTNYSFIHPETRQKFIIQPSDFDFRFDLTRKIYNQLRMTQFLAFNNTSISKMGNTLIHHFVKDVSKRALPRRFRLSFHEKLFAKYRTSPITQQFFRPEVIDSLTSNTGNRFYHCDINKCYIQSMYRLNGVKIPICCSMDNWREVHYKSNRDITDQNNLYYYLVEGGTTQHGIKLKTQILMDLS